MSEDILKAQRQHLADLLVAIQRCAWFLHCSEQKLSWPLDGEALSTRKKDVDLFETLAALNERFAKLQDSLAAAMRHGAVLLGGPDGSFLRILSYFEKVAVVESIDMWQRGRTARNLAAHDYETDYAEIADHFNTLQQLSGSLYRTAIALVEHYRLELSITPANGDFEAEFERLRALKTAPTGP